MKQLNLEGAIKQVLKSDNICSEGKDDMIKVLEALKK